MKAPDLNLSEDLVVALGIDFATVQGRNVEARLRPLRPLACAARKP